MFLREFTVNWVQKSEDKYTEDTQLAISPFAHGAPQVKSRNKNLGPPAQGPLILVKESTNLGARRWRCR